MFDYLIVGSGFFGSVFANQVKKNGKSVLILEKRNHIGGNCFTENIDGIPIHKYGAHIFHTSDINIWNFVNTFCKFNSYQHHVIANYKNEYYSLPFNMWTFNKMWGVNTPKDAIKIINEQKFIGTPKNFEEQALQIVGRDIYERLIKGYTKKHWRIDPVELSVDIIKRLPVRFTFNNNYYFDKYQGIPENGYTELFEKMLMDIEVKLNTDYFVDKSHWDSIAKRIVYTGPIDKFYNYKYGKLDYLTLRFENKNVYEDNYQGHSVINFTDESIPYTRIIEHKHFYENRRTNNSIITYEYSDQWTVDKEPYYPINNVSNMNTYNLYKKDMELESKFIFGGRLAEYKYYDMHQVIASALHKSKLELL
jgi:UDP-galactopyranose mutase